MAFLVWAMSRDQYSRNYIYPQHRSQHSLGRTLLLNVGREAQKSCPSESNPTPHVPSSTSTSTSTSTTTLIPLPPTQKLSTPEPMLPFTFPPVNGGHGPHETSDDRHQLHCTVCTLYLTRLDSIQWVKTLLQKLDFNLPRISMHSAVLAVRFVSRPVNNKRLVGYYGWLLYTSQLDSGK